MSHLVLSLLLDDGGREVAGVVSAVLVAVVLAVFLAVATPVLVVLSPPGGRGLPSTSAPPATTLSPLPATAPADPRPTGALIDTARRYLGVPYVFGGVNPAIGLDCSGLVQLVFRQVGIPLPRTAQQQYDATRRVQREALQPGDLVFFARTYADPTDWVTHVGIYLGDGLQINAPTEGQVVSIQPVFSGFWGAHYAGAGRVLAG